MKTDLKFESTPTDKAPDPELGTKRIPVDRYTEQKYISLEDERLWSKSWLLAGVEVLEMTVSTINVALVKNKVSPF